MKRVLAGLACAALLFGATACGDYNDARGKGDAPAGVGDDSAAAITNMPDDFPNVARKCLVGSEPWAAAVNTDGGMVLYQDPKNCGGKPIPGATQVVAGMRKVTEG